MSWDHIGKPLSTVEGSASPPTLYQKFRITTGYKNQILKSVVAGLFFYNLPAFGTVKLEIWSDDGGVPGRKMAETDSFTQAECNTNNFAYRVLGFTLTSLLALKKNTYYYLVVRPSSYTGDASSHIAWRQSWPDPQYSSGITLTLEYGAKFPFECIFETADL